jgi:hypothetical protein
MAKKTKVKKIPEGLILLLMLVGFVLLSGVSYFMFNSYRYNIPQAPREVKGSKDEWSFDLPIPIDSFKLASNRTSDIQQITIQTAKTPEEVQIYYQNVFLDQNWKLDSESEEDGFFIKEYISEGKTASVVASAQTGENYSIASIEIVFE